ncbi:MAG: TetR family transcriptional regulator [Pseudonocardiaceae bacterium]|nr:TetR family transcriptional regulator [Pseudonocardiaceae bacterium]
MATSQPRTSRAEQRQKTENRILTAARRLFADSGYDRTTIRAIAAEAKTDPGLVMRYFGSKKELFALVAEIAPDEPVTGTPEQAAEHLLTSLGDKLEAEPSATLAMLRSMLTHPEAAKEVRAAVTNQQRDAAAAFPGDDAVLRAGLIGALTLGTVLGRHLLRLDGLRDAPPEAITALLRPCFHALVDGEAEHAADGQR